MINPNFLVAREHYNEVYKKYLFFNSFYGKAYKQEFIDLFSASTFSKVVPQILAKEEYAQLLTEGNYYQNYPSPEGDQGFLDTFRLFIKKIYNLDISRLDTMVCQGTMQAIDAISTILTGKVVFVMDSTVTFAKSIPAANGAKVVLVKTNNGLIDLEDLEEKILQYEEKDWMYLYLNYPNNPTGSQVTLDELNKIVSLTQKYNLRVVHDHDICLTSYSEDRPVISLFHCEAALNNCIEIYTLSKEFGLSGLRVGIIVGNKDIVSAIKYHNYEMNVMVPLFNQKVAELAIKKINPPEVRERISESMETLVSGFRDLGWSDLKFPHAGISFLLPVPRMFEEEYGDKSGELFAFHLQKDFGVSVGPAVCNCFDKANYIRVLSMESKAACEGMFLRLKGKICPDMSPPGTLYNEYEEMSKISRNYNIR